MLRISAVSAASHAAEAVEGTVPVPVPVDEEERVLQDVQEEGEGVVDKDKEEDCGGGGGGGIISIPDFTSKTWLCHSLRSAWSRPAYRCGVIMYSTPMMRALGAALS
jgi:hypothetical protein